MSYDWTGLDHAIFKAGANLGPPPLALNLALREFDPEERESLGREVHRNWVAVRKQHISLGQAVPDEELRPWRDLSEDQKEAFRRSAESLALSESLMWDAVVEMRRKMGERAFRKKMFEMSVTVAFQKMVPARTEAERYRVTDILVKLSNMLEVPPAGETTGK